MNLKDIVQQVSFQKCWTARHEMGAGPNVAGNIAPEHGVNHPLSQRDPQISKHVASHCVDHVLS